MSLENEDQCYSPPADQPSVASLRMANPWVVVAGKHDLGFGGDVARRKRRGQDQCGQATKGVWGMSWRQEAKKGVEDCDKPGGLVKRELIPGCPNDCTMNP